MTALPLTPLSQRPSVLLVVTQSTWGGAQKYVHDLALGLERDFQLAVAAGSGGELLQSLSSAGVQTFALRSMTRDVSPVRDVLAVLELRQLLKDNKFDIVHANSSKAGVVARLAARIEGVPVVLYTVHGLVLSEPLSLTLKGLYWLMEKVGAACSDRLIAVSEADKVALTRHRIKRADAVKVINVGCSPREFKPRKHLGIVVGTVANFYPVKGYRYLIPAMARIAALRPDVQFRVVGRGMLVDWVRSQLNQNGLDSIVQIIDEPVDAWSQMRDCDIFVLASVKEGFPYSILEAMHAGIPVVATAVGGIPEQISDGTTGLLVPPGDAAALAEGVLRLVEDTELRRRLGRAAKARAAAEFSLERMIDRTRQLYVERVHSARGVAVS